MKYHVLFAILLVSLIAAIGYIITLSHMQLQCHGTVAFNEDVISMEDPLAPIDTNAKYMPKKKPSTHIQGN